MKTNLLVSILSLATVLFFACKQESEKVIEQHTDGSPKKIIRYSGNTITPGKKTEISYFASGNKEIEGDYDANEKRTGRWTAWYENGKTWSVCDYKNGVKDGENTVYYENGTKRYENFYTEGKPSGIWKYWDANGNLQKEINYTKK